MERLTDEENFNLVADRIEAEYHGDIRIIIESNYEGEFHIEVQEVADEGDEEGENWEDITSDGWYGWFTINEKYHLKDYKEATEWLEKHY